MLLSARRTVRGPPDQRSRPAQRLPHSARLREVRSAAAKLGVANLTIWSGAEFDDDLRLRAEFLLQCVVECVFQPIVITDSGPS